MKCFEEQAIAGADPGFQVRGRALFFPAPPPPGSAPE